MSRQTPPYCRVRGCRHPHTHLTIAHKCGICNAYGHGRLECNNAFRINQLSEISCNDQLPEAMWCIVTGCRYPWSHASSAHHCNSCGCRGYHSGDCIHMRAHETNELTFLTCPICKEYGEVNMTTELFTGTSCAVCLESSKMVVFNKCNHAQVCKNCVIRMLNLEKNE